MYTYGHNIRVWQHVANGSSYKTVYAGLKYGYTTLIYSLWILVLAK